MPKLRPDTQRARREHILDAAELSFARTGFHRTTMQDICREADVSAGALYLYFASKEDLIAGIAERDRAHLAEQLAVVATAPDLMAALAQLGQHYMVEEPRHKQQMVVELGCESMRGGPVGEIFRACDAAVIQQFEALFSRAVAEGKIRPDLNPKILAQSIAVIGDGLFWRRAVDPAFDAATMVPIVTGLIASLLNPTSAKLDPSPSLLGDAAALATTTLLHREFTP
jgi:TetR/AcrR family transcriptional regulator, repressor for uid operon